MDEWFSRLAAGSELSVEKAWQLQEDGFLVLPGLVAVGQIDRLARAYDAAVASAADADVKRGTTTTRVNDFVNRGSDFADIYVLPPLLEACCRIIGGPFKLSSMHARTLRPCSTAQELHVDVQRESADWPLAGFILMVDEFRTDNGATRFVPGSHRWSSTPQDFMPDRRADYDGQVLACGPAGSLVIFDGSVWHGHTANSSDRPRRSLQGAFVPRVGRSGIDFTFHMSPESRARLDPLAYYVLQI